MCPDILLWVVLFVWFIIFLYVTFTPTTHTVFVVNKPVLMVFQEGRNTMADTLTYVINAAAPIDSDVIQRELIATVNGEVISTTVWAGSSVDLGTLAVPQDSQVELSLTDIDDAGNRSSPAVVTFVASDTIPPSAPGSIGVTLVGETTEPRADN